MRFENGYYYSASQFYKEKFGEKIYKISLDAGCTCPNRDGTKGLHGCIFCSGSGSGDFAASRLLSISEQIIEAKKNVSGKYKGNKYIAYFQNFTNTYGNVKVLEEKYNAAIKCDGIVGVSIATRPDCLSEEILEVLKDLSYKTFLTVELGLQTCSEKSIEYIRRCYDNSEYLDAVKKIHELNKNIHVVTHIIFGLPYESEEDMLRTVDYAVKAGTDGVKIALLHVLKNTDLEIDYKNNLFNVFEMDEYFLLLKKALSNIPENIVIHRLTGDGAKKLLIAPMWTQNKKNVINSLNNFFKENNVLQGVATDN